MSAHHASRKDLNVEFLSDGRQGLKSGIQCSDEIGFAATFQAGSGSKARCERGAGAHGACGEGN